MQWKPGVLTTGLPGKSPPFKVLMFFFQTFFSMHICILAFFLKPRPYSTLFYHLPSHGLHNGYFPSSPDLLYCTSFQAPLEASPFSNGLEGLEVWYEAQHDHILSFQGPGDQCAHSPGGDVLWGRTHTHTSALLTNKSPQTHFHLAQCLGCALLGLCFNG